MPLPIRKATVDTERDLTKLGNFGLQPSRRLLCVPVWPEQAGLMPGVLSLSPRLTSAFGEASDFVVKCGASLVSVISQEIKCMTAVRSISSRDTPQADLQRRSVGQSGRACCEITLLAPAAY